jgi:uncharacterized SAM-binding protein YcdF (DUF218 family)
MTVSAIGTSTSALKRPWRLSRRFRTWWWLGLPVVVAVLLILNRASVLRWMGAYLVVEQPLEHAQAIVVLAGQMPFRELEAASLYRDGWASQIVLVPGFDKPEHRAMADLGVTITPDWQLRRQLLERLGVPAQALVVAQGAADDTLTELELADRAIHAEAGPVILVTSKYHARRVQSAWHHIADPSRPGVVRVAQRDPFDPDRWWTTHEMRTAVAHEYLGLLELIFWRPAVQSNG